MDLPVYEPTDFAATVFKDRYPIHPDETYAEASARVGHHVAGSEEGKKREEFSKRFTDLLLTNRFSPGGRIWRGAGRPRGQMLNCFVISDDIDSREGWGETLKHVTIISGLGGGVGINFSRIRPRGTKINGTGGESTGSVSLMKAVNAVCNELREGGGRRSALMFALDYDHPDLPEFLRVKLDQKELRNANISVLIDDKFIDLVSKDEEIVLSWLGEERGRIRAREVWDKIVQNSWACGDPGLLNKGYANKMNTVYYRTSLIATNPCGEQWLSAFDSCDLGAVVLPTHVRDGKIDWDMLEETVTLGVRFLDDVLDRNVYPFPAIEEAARKYRRIGLGVMGLHDLLLELGIRYGSQEALKVTGEVMDFVKKRAYEASIMLAVEKGPFPLLDREKHADSGFAKKCLTPTLRRKIREYGIRNACLLTLAPTGTIAIVAGVSSGIEPLFSPVYLRLFNQHAKMHEEGREQGKEIVVHPLLKRFVIQGRDVSHFEGAHEITPAQHLAMQQVCQAHIDNSISKTINLPADSTPEQLSDLLLANIGTLKGVTVYRDGSKGASPMQPIPISEAKEIIGTLREEASVNDCPNGKCSLS